MSPALFASILAACASASPAQDAPAAAEASTGSEQANQGGQVRNHMETNFRLAIDARDALIHGNLAAAKESAKKLAFHDPSKVLPERWMADVEKMQSAAEALAIATELPQAGAALAELASTCGDCHSRLNYSGGAAAEEHGLSPQGSEDVHERMKRHQVAADKLWYGLTIPSDGAWRSGARALTEAPLTPLHEGEHQVAPEFHDKMEDIIGMGRTALEADTRTKRAEVYGSLLLSCANCHSE